MSGKYLIFGATGNIGSNLAEKLYNSDQDIHLIGRNKEEVKSLSEKFKCTYSVVDVLENNFIDKVKSEIQEVKGTKCQRCWKYERKLINEEICIRCDEAVKSVSE